MEIVYSHLFLPGLCSNPSLESKWVCGYWVERVMHFLPYFKFVFQFVIRRNLMSDFFFFFFNFLMGNLVKNIPDVPDDV